MDLRLAKAGLLLHGGHRHWKISLELMVVEVEVVAEVGLDYVSF
jgi:hypothetical protein